MTTQATPDIPERVSRLEGAYEQVTERLRDLTESVKALHSETGSLKTTIIVIGGGCLGVHGGRLHRASRHRLTTRSVVRAARFPPPTRVQGDSRDGGIIALHFNW